MKVVVASRSRLFRDALVTALQSEDDMVAAPAESLAGLLDICRTAAPQVVVASTSFEDGELTTVVSDVLRHGPRMLVMCDPGDGAISLLLAGASGCLDPRCCSVEELIAATRNVAAGQAALHPAAAAAVLRQWRSTRATDSADGTDTVPNTARTELSQREKQVLEALSRGLTTKQISKDLAVSAKTVEAHASRMMVKLGARNRAHAVTLAQARGLVFGPRTTSPKRFDG